MIEHNKLSTWATNIAPSPTLAVDAKAKELKAAGEDVCGFGAGEPDFDTPAFIKEACAQALSDGRTKYAPAAGIPDLRAAIAEKYRDDNGVAGVEASQVVVSPGGKFSCYLAILSVISPGDEVLVEGPEIMAPFGEVVTEDRSAIILRASVIERLWTRATGDLEVMELCEFSFSEEATL